jgi:hypothetical protein
MSSSWRRFEVLLPIQFNDGREVPPDWLAEAVLEVADHFGSASYETQKVEGHWRHGGVVYGSRGRHCSTASVPRCGHLNPHTGGSG